MNNIDYNKPTILWKKWVDPLLNDDTESILKGLLDLQRNLDTEEEVRISTPVKMIPHPIYGAVPVTEHCQIGKMFKLWVGHTNFNVTKRITQIIGKTPGVEALNILTPYRFRIGVGMAFKDSTVMTEIVNNISKYNKDLDILQSIIEEDAEESPVLPPDNEETSSV